MIDKKKRFIYNEADYETPKQSPKNNQTWPMDKINRQSSLLLSPTLTPKRNYSISNAKSLLLQCLRASKSDPFPRSRRFRDTYSDEDDDGILMDSVLATKKVSSCTSSIFKSHQQGEYSQAANPLKPQASVEVNTLTTRSPPREASPFLPQQLPYDHYNPLFPWTHPLHLQPYPYLRRSPLYLYQRPLLLLPVLPHDIDQLGPNGYPIKKTPPVINNPYQLDSQEAFPSLADAKKPTRRELRNSHLTVPPSNQQPVLVEQEPDLSSPSDGLEQVMQPSPSDGLESLVQEPDLTSPSHGLEAVMRELGLSSLSDGVEPVAQEPDLSSSFDGLEAMMRELGLSSSSGGLEPMAQAPGLTSPSDGVEQPVAQEQDIQEPELLSQEELDSILASN